MSTPVVVKIQPASAVIVQTKAGPAGPQGPSGSPVSAVGQTITATDWYINPSTGNDGNTGTSSISPLKTWAGLLLKWGYGPIFKPSSGGFINVHVQGGSLPLSDPAVLRSWDLGADANVMIRGEAATTVRTGTITAVTARSGNQGWNITDSGMAGTWTTDIGRRIRVTSGPNTGMIAWVYQDLGTKKAFVSQPASIAAPTTGGYPGITEGIFSVGDTYVIETLTGLYLGEFFDNGRHEGDSQTHPGRIFIQDFEIQNTGRGNAVIAQSIGALFLGCRNLTAFNVVQASGAVFANCGVDLGLDVDVSECSVLGGLYRGVGIFAEGLASVSIGNNALIGSASLSGIEAVGGSNIDIESCGVYNSAQHGVRVGDIANDVGPGQLTIQGSLYGTGNAGAGVYVDTSCSAQYATLPTITGTGGDFQLGGATSARAWNETTGQYTAGITCTWAHLAAAIGSGGFGGSAHCLDGHSHITTGTGTGGGAAPPAGTITGIASTGAGAGVIANGTSGANVQVKSLVQGANITITNNANDITIAAASGFTPPTGTGFVTVTAGALDAASLAFPLAIAKGGTNATSFTTSGGVVRYNGSTLVNAAGHTDDGAGNITMSSSLAIGTTPAGAGYVRVPYNGGIAVTVLGWKDSVGTDRAFITYGAGNAAVIGEQTSLVDLQLQTAGPSVLNLSSSGCALTVAGSFGWNQTTTQLQSATPIVGLQSASSPYSAHGDTTVAMADANYTLAAADYASTAIRFTGGLTALRTISFPVPSAGAGYAKLVSNMCTGANGKLTFQLVGGAGATVTPFDNQTTGPTVNAAWLWIDSNGVHLACQKFAGW